MHRSSKSSLKRLFCILVFALLAVYTLAPTQGIADGNGGFPVGGQGAGDSLPPQPVPEYPDGAEQSPSFLSTLVIIALLTI